MNLGEIYVPRVIPNKFAGMGAPLFLAQLCFFENEEIKPLYNEYSENSMIKKIARDISGGKLIGKLSRKILGSRKIEGQYGVLSFAFFKRKLRKELEQRSYNITSNRFYFR